MPAAVVLIRRIRAASEMPLTVGAIVSTRAVGVMGDKERGDLGDLDLLEDEEGRRLGGLLLLSPLLGGEDAALPTGKKTVWRLIECIPSS